MWTNVCIELGDFWNVPTRRGGWQCCGVVLLSGRPAGSRVLLVAALLDWREPFLPDCRSITGVDVVDVGVIHLGAIEQSGSSHFTSSRSAVKRAGYSSADVARIQTFRAPARGLRDPVPREVDQGATSQPTHGDQAKGKMTW